MADQMLQEGAGQSRDSAGYELHQVQAGRWYGLIFLPEFGIWCFLWVFLPVFCDFLPEFVFFYLLSFEVIDIETYDIGSKILHWLLTNKNIRVNKGGNLKNIPEDF